MWLEAWLCTHSYISAFCNEYTIIWHALLYILVYIFNKNNVTHFNLCSKDVTVKSLHFQNLYLVMNKYSEVSFISSASCLNGQLYIVWKTCEYMFKSWYLFYVTI